MSASISAEDIQKMITGNSTEKYIGEAGGHSPILDLVNRLSGQLNQQTAESNLVRGGAGYGGSFMNADQLAAREAGTKLNAKPYGGWGGYGSGNSTMTKVPAGPTTYVPPVRGGGTVPVDPRGAPPPVRGGAPPVHGGGTSPIDPRGDGGGNPRVPPPPGVPVETVPGVRSAPYTGEQPTGRTSPGAYSPEVWGGNLKPGDPGWSEAWSRGGGPSGGFGSGNPNFTVEEQSRGAAPTAATNSASVPDASASAAAAESGGSPYNDPDVRRIYEQLVRDGMRTSGMINSDSVKNAIAAGVSPELIYANFKAILDAAGPAAFNAMHGAASMRIGNPQSMSDGTYVADAVANIGGPKMEPRPITPPKDPLPAPGQKAAPGVTDNSRPSPGPGAPPTIPGEVPPPPGTSGFDVNGKPYNNPNPIPTGTTGTASQGLGNQNPPWLDPGAPGYNPKGGDVIASAFNPGKDWGTQPSAPKGMQEGDVFTLPTGEKQVMVAPGRYSNWYVNSKGESIFGYMKDGLDGQYLNAPDEAIRPVVGGKAIIGYDENGNPIYNDNGMFEQGDNASGVGDNTPDAWSNSPDWRPEEPTGGLYGAYTDLAGGNLTDYENAIGQKWRDLSENPSTPDDLAYKNLVAEYTKSPGKGVDEAYGAYNKMLQGNGYSDVEKGAMEGSAVRGLSEGFKQGADEIRRQGARTNNRAAAYAALGSGGGAYGASLGETNRQNQIKFADEAQRRQEAGAAGMTNVAGISNTRAQFGIGAAGDYSKEMARRKEAGIAGMGDFATYGRGLQSQGLAGLNDMLKQSNADKNNTYAQIAALLGTNVGQKSGGTSDTKTRGYGAGIQI